MKRQVITVPTIGTDTGFTATQHYQYDELNRLTGAQEVNGVNSAWQTSGQPLWQQCFTYDRFGNRSMDTANTDSTLIGPNPQISTSTNRIVPRTTPSLEYYEYDLTGNLKKGQGGDTFAYNGENKLVQYEGGSTQIGGANYFYDGDGRRVKKAKPPETLIFVYNILGQLVAEYTTSTPESNGTSYLTSDTLGTPRVVANSVGIAKSRHDYLPFGEEIGVGVGGRTTTHGYSQTDNIRQKFTGYERDNETGLDYAQARYYSHKQGRFTSVDPLLSSGEVAEPQSWNRYAHTLNNPLKYTDPLGLFVWSDAMGGDKTDDELLEMAGGDKKATARANDIIKQRDRFRNALIAARIAAANSDSPLEVIRAINSYGTERVANGVTVTFGTTAKGAAAETTAYGQNLIINSDGSVTASILVTINEKTTGNELTLGVAHEGQHVLDRQEYARIVNSRLAMGFDQDLIFTSRFNPTVRPDTNRDKTKNDYGGYSSTC